MMTRAALLLTMFVALAAAAAETTENEGPPADAELVSFPSGDLTLRGFLYRPTGPGPFPAIVWNHGSEPKPG